LADDVDLSQLQARLGITFAKSAHLEEAFTHPSYRNEHPDLPLADNERLEFLGDAFLGYVIALELFGRFPEASEGQLTQLRAAIVKQDSLARAAAALGLGESLRLGRGEEQGGGRHRPANLAAVFEALTGALLLDRGPSATQRFLLKVLHEEMSRVISGEGWLDAKSRLQELIQAEGKPTPRYQVLSSTGPDHDRRFLVAVVVSGQTLGQGEGKSKQEAEKAAASDALGKMGE